MKKGAFWIVMDLRWGKEIEVESAYLVGAPINLEIVPAPSHKETWTFIGNEYNVSWNYYPRGRVEIRRGKAFVFAKPYCFLYVGLEKDLCKTFELQDMEIVFKVDNSEHYSVGGYELPDENCCTN